MPYIDWEYYSSLYTNVTKNDFNKQNNKATAKIDVFTHMRVKNFILLYDAATATGWQKNVVEQIKNTVCELINLLSEQEASSAGTGITSISNDGYSETYKITTQAEKDAELRSLVINGLSGTGLAGAV